MYRAHHQRDGGRRVPSLLRTTRPLGELTRIGALRMGIHDVGTSQPVILAPSPDRVEDGDEVSEREGGEVGEEGGRRDGGLNDLERGLRSIRVRRYLKRILRYLEVLRSLPCGPGLRFPSPQGTALTNPLLSSPPKPPQRKTRKCNKQHGRRTSPTIYTPSPTTRKRHDSILSRSASQALRGGGGGAGTTAKKGLNSTGGGRRMWLNPPGEVGEGVGGK